MTINDLLRQWSISIPENAYLFEYLLENRRPNCFYIDRFPITVSKENSDKFDQIDIFFQEVSERKANKEDFLRIETQYRNVMRKLWLYNKLYVEFDIETVNNTNLNDIIDRVYHKYISSCFNADSGTELIEIRNKEELDFWNQIGIRDAAFPVLFLEEFQMLLTPCWSCYIAYFNELSKYGIVKDIAMSEGLFLREPQLNNTYR